MCTNRSTQYRATTMDQAGNSCRSRHYRMLRTLAFLSMSGQSMSLIIPGRPTCPASLPRQGTSGISYGMQYRHQKRRRRSLDFELHVQFTSNQDWDLYQTKMYSFQFYPSYKLLQPSRPVAHHNSRRSSESSPKRMSTSLYLAQSSDSAGSGFGKDDEEKKDREKSDNSKGGGPKPKANKNSINSGNASGVIKGTSTPNNNNNNNRNSNSSNNATKNTNTNDQAKRIGKKNKNKGKTKSGTNASHDSSTSTETGSGGVIKTSNDNTSLKGFKSNKYVPPPTKIEKEQQAAQYPKENKKENNTEEDLKKRVVQLETIVSNQMTEIQKLQRKVEDLTRATSVFSNVVDVLREAGIQIDEVDDVVVGDVDPGGDDDNRSLPTPNTSQQRKMINDDMEIFGLAPKSVTDAADAAGASMLSAILAGKHRMLVDVRDAELTRDPKLFVEFIELAILPVAAGLEGLGNEFRNRVKIVFPTVKDLMQYRRSMALAAPEVVSLSTLGFDPIDDRDNLIVIVAPSPDDIAGVSAMKKLISRTEKNYVEPDRRITQPVVVMNHHMVPVDMSGFGKFTTVYHLRLLSVQYMTGDAAPEYVTKLDAEENSAQESTDMNTDNTLSGEASTLKSESRNDDSNEDNAHKSNNSAKSGSDRSEEEDEALEAAMIHAHEVGVHQGVTRAMVIRAYPKPWHVFVDTSPDTDADFEVAATFDIEPTQEDVNFAIVECLEGSEREDELVAQQMQAALEAGQLNRVADMLGILPSDIVTEDKSVFLENDGNDNEKPYEGKNWDDLFYDDWLNEDSL